MSMEITYDKDADAMYIMFSSVKVARTKKIDDLTMIDFDQKGGIIGIELLEASKRIPPESFADIRVKNLVMSG